MKEFKIVLSGPHGLDRQNLVDAIYQYCKESDHDCTVTDPQGGDYGCRFGSETRVYLNVEKDR